MTILLVNDDGYKAEGLNVLADTLERAGHEVWICAPEGQRSATSHHMTLGGEVRATLYAPNRWYLSGYPSDCVLYALRGHLFPHDPDMVVAGINQGFNISTDILYSGTIGAASEAALAGIPTFALSCEGVPLSDSFPFQETADFFLEHLEEFLPLCGPEAVVSINVPSRAGGRWAVGKMTHLHYDDAVLEKTEGKTRVFDARGAKFGSSIVLVLSGGKGRQDWDTAGSDWELVKKNIISVSVLGVLPAISREGQERLEEMASANT